MHLPHANCSIAPMDWWEITTYKVSELINVRPYAQLYIRIDANARSPASDDTHFGSFGYLSSSATTPYFYKIVKKLELWPPSTFDDFSSYSSDVGTYFWSPFKVPVRIDFILIPT